MKRLLIALTVLAMSLPAAAGAQAMSRQDIIDELYDIAERFEELVASNQKLKLEAAAIKKQKAAMDKIRDRHDQEDARLASRARELDRKKQAYEQKSCSMEYFYCRHQYKTLSEEIDEYNRARRVLSTSVKQLNRAMKKYNVRVDKFKQAARVNLAELEKLTRRDEELRALLE